MRNSERKELIDKVCRRTLEKESLDTQVKTLIQSMEGLIQELSGFKDDSLNPEILEKMACVKILIRQLELGFDCEASVKRVMEFKASELARDLDLGEI